MNVIAGVIGGVVGAVLALTVRLVINHPLACLVAVAALVALARGVPGPVVIAVLVVGALVSGLRKGRH